MKKWLGGLKYASVAVGLAVLALMIMDFNSRMTDWRRLSVEQEKVALDVTRLAKTEAALLTQIAYATSPAGVYQWAYEEGHWVRSGDKLVVPISPNESTPVPTPMPMVAQEEVSNWQLWLALFIDLPSE